MGPYNPGPICSCEKGSKYPPWAWQQWSWGLMPSWPRSESPIGKRKLIFPSLKVDMLVLMVSSFWVVSFFHSVSTSTYHSPSWTWNPEKKKSWLPSSESESVLPFEKPFFYSLHPWTLAWENCVLNGWGKFWSFFLTRLPEFCPSQLVCLQNFGPRTTILL